MFSGSITANDVWLFLAQAYADAGGTNRNVGGNVIPSGIVQLSFGVSLQVDGGYTQGAFVGNVQEFDTDYGAVFGGVSIRNFSLNNPETNLGNITSTTRAIRIHLDSYGQHYGWPGGARRSGRFSRAG